MTTDLEGAVERFTLDLIEIEDHINDKQVRVVQHSDNDWAVRYLGDLAKDGRTILDAIASMTRERDEARQENERLRTVIVGRRSVLSATIAALKSWRKRATKAEAERDAMREALRPFWALAECGCTFTEEDLRGEHDDEDWFRHDGCALKIGHFRRAAALVNGEVG